MWKIPWWYWQYKNSQEPTRIQSTGPSTGHSLKPCSPPTSINFILTKKSSTNVIINPITYSNYKTENNLVFSNPYLGLVNRSLSDETEKKNITKDRRGDFINVDAYQHGQFSEKICDPTAGNNINSLNLTTRVPGGANAFTKQWDEAKLSWTTSLLLSKISYRMEWKR